MMRFFELFKRLLTAVLLGQSLTTLALAQERHPVLNVVDAKGNPVRGAFVEAGPSRARITSDSEGRIYLPSEFDGLSVRVRKLGYVPADVTIASSRAPQSVRLLEAASQLQNVSIVSKRLAPITRLVSASSVKQVPALSEPDIFRAAVLLPAVSQPNDLRGRLHLAGGASDETSITLDGHPLQDPFHVLGLLGAFNLGALDEATVRIHHVPANFRSGLSGTIGLDSKTVSETPAGEAIVGLLSGAATVTRPNVYHGSDLMMSFRSTYLDKLLEHLANEASFGGDNLTLLGYRDGIVTMRVPLSKKTSVKLTAFGTSDSKTFQDTSRSRNRSYNWGEGLLGFAFVRNSLQWSQAFSGSFNRAFAKLPSEVSSAGSLGQLVNLRHDLASASFDVTRKSKGRNLEFGASVDHRETDQRWHGLPSDFFTQHAPENFLGFERQTIFDIHATQITSVSSRTLLETGVRIPTNGSHAFVGPRVAISTDLSDAITFASSFDIRHQFTGELEEPREGSGKQPLFLLDVPRTATIGAVSLAKWVKTSEGEKINSAEAVLFYKLYRNKPYFRFDESTEDQALSAVKSPRFGRISAQSLGATLSVNQRFGRATMVQGSYTYQRVKDRIDGENIPTMWDIPHSVSVFATSSLGRNWFGSTTVLAHSGQTVTPIAARLLTSEKPTDIFLSNRYLFGETNSARLSPYFRVDVGLQRRWGGPKNARALSLQVLNVFGRKNALEWDWATYFCVKAGACKEPDVIRKGLPIIPTLSFEAHW